MSFFLAGVRMKLLIGPRTDRDLEQVETYRNLNLILQEFGGVAGMGAAKGQLCTRDPRCPKPNRHTGRCKVGTTFLAHDTPTLAQNRSSRSCSPDPAGPAAEDSGELGPQRAGSIFSTDHDRTITDVSANPTDQSNSNTSAADTS